MWLISEDILKNVFSILIFCLTTQHFFLLLPLFCLYLNLPHFAQYIFLAVRHLVNFYISLAVFALIFVWILKINIFKVKSVE